jgi:hypothetical protein
VSSGSDSASISRTRQQTGTSLACAEPLDHCEKRRAIGLIDLRSNIFNQMIDVLGVCQMPQDALTIWFNKEEIKLKNMPKFTRRTFLASTALATLAGYARAAETAASAVAAVGGSTGGSTPVLSVVAGSPYLCNAAAVALDGTIFLGLPRHPGMGNTPGVVRLRADGGLDPFPGGDWNNWAPGRDGTSAFVQANTVHIFRDGTLWVVDQGTPDGSEPAPGVQKLVQLDTKTGAVLQVIRFPKSILPPGAQMNDLRINGNRIFITDSGIGGLIVHDLSTGHTVRRLSRNPATCMDSRHVRKGRGGRLLKDGAGNPLVTQSDDIEIDPAGEWFYFSTPAGPLKRVRVADLLNPKKSDAELAREVQIVAEIPCIGGTAMDTLGNLYIGDVENSRIMILAPDGRMVTLIQDDRIAVPDAMYIDGDRRLYIPCPQQDLVPEADNGRNETKPPFMVYSLQLPASLDGIRLGNALM